VYRRRQRRLAAARARHAEAAKQRKLRAEQADKDRIKKARAAVPGPVGKWCQCEVVKADWTQPYSWIGCPSDSLLTGFYRAPQTGSVKIGNATLAASDSLSGITALQCCKACNSLNHTLPIDTCTHLDKRFLKLGVLSCPGNTFAAGMRRKDCLQASCLDQMRCCSLDGSRGRRDTCHLMKPAAGSSFLPALKSGWSLVESDTFVIGLERQLRRPGLDALNPFVCAFFGRE